jgi:uncharacterized membrane protein YhaH (DUF805 family)
MHVKRRIGSRWRLLTISAWMCIVLAVGLLVAKIGGQVSISWWVISATCVLLAIVGLATLPPQPELLARRMRDNGRRTRLRCLGHIIPPGWISIRDGPHQWIHLPLLWLINARYRVSIYLSVDQEGADEDNSLISMQRKAEQFTKEWGFTMIRNEIHSVAGVRGIDFEYVTAKGELHRKIIIIRHRSEYVITLRAASTGLFEIMQPVWETFVETLKLNEPDLPRREALGRAVRIGLPQSWVQVEDTVMRAKWRSPTDDARLTMRLIDQSGEGLLDMGQLKRLEGSSSEQVPTKYSFTFHETGAHVDGAFSTQSTSSALRRQDAFSVTLPTGLRLALDFERDDDRRPIIIGLASVPFLLEVIATIEDG